MWTQEIWATRGVEYLMKRQTCFLCFFSASVDRRFLCQTSWAAGCFAGSEGEGRNPHPNNSSIAFSSIVEPQKVTQLNASGENTGSFIAAEIVHLWTAGSVRYWTEASLCCCVLWLLTQPWSTRGWLMGWWHLIPLQDPFRMWGAGSILKKSSSVEGLWTPGRTHYLR